MEFGLGGPLPVSGGLPDSTLEPSQGSASTIRQRNYPTVALPVSQTANQVSSATLEMPVPAEIPLRPRSFAKKSYYHIWKKSFKAVKNKREEEMYRTWRLDRASLLQNRVAVAANVSSGSIEIELSYIGTDVSNSSVVKEPSDEFSSVDNWPLSSIDEEASVNKKEFIG